MDVTTKKVARYIKDKGVSILAMSKKTNIPISRLYSSLSPNGKRCLRADEFLTICAFLEKEPTDFIDDKVS